MKKHYLIALWLLSLGMNISVTGVGQRAGPISDNATREREVERVRPPRRASLRANEQQRAGPTSNNASRERETMVRDQIQARGVKDDRVLAAMRKVPRERFVPSGVAAQAYADQPLPIGFGQTISQPYIVAYMSEALQVSKNAKVLEIGTGSGYQAAILGELAREVYTIEIVQQLAGRARETLGSLGYKNIQVRAGDGYAGWPEQAPFDGIMVTAAPDHVPQPLIDQLAVGGRMVIPVGRAFQEILIVSRTQTGIVQRRTIPVRFVPLVRRPR